MMNDTKVSISLQRGERVLLVDGSLTLLRQLFATVRPGERPEASDRLAEERHEGRKEREA